MIARLISCLCLSSISLLASVVGGPSSPTNISTPTCKTLFLVSRGEYCREGCGVCGLGAIGGGGVMGREGGWVGRGGEWAEERRGFGVGRRAAL